MPLESPRTARLSGTTGRRPVLHILSTSFLDGNEVLVILSDGSSAIYEMEELEKLRPTPKRILAASAAPDASPTDASPTDARPTYAEVA
jgi:hypothetical protein